MKETLEREIIMIPSHCVCSSISSWRASCSNIMDSREHTLSLSLQPSSPPLNMLKFCFPEAHYLTILPSFCPLASAKWSMWLTLARLQHREAGKERRSSLGLFLFFLHSTAVWEDSDQPERMVISTVTRGVSQISLLILPFAYGLAPRSVLPIKT